MRLIDADALKNELSDKDYITYTHEYGDAIPVNWIMNAIDNAPTVERPQGEWITDIDNIPLCKNCGEIALQRVYVRTPQLLEEVSMVKSNFCPNCGADMRKEAENDDS